MRNVTKYSDEEKEKKPPQEDERSTSFSRGERTWFLLIKRLDTLPHKRETYLREKIKGPPIPEKKTST